MFFRAPKAVPALQHPSAGEGEQGHWSPWVKAPEPLSLLHMYHKERKEESSVVWRGAAFTEGLTVMGAQGNGNLKYYSMGSW